MQRIRQDNKNSQEYWDFQHATRPQEGAMRFELVAELIKRIVDADPRSKSQMPLTILDIGCGQGELYKYLIKNGVQCVFTGIDFAPSATKKNRLRYPGAQWITADISALDVGVNKYYDVVVACEVLEHMEEPKVLADEMKRLVKENGTLIVTTPLRNSVPSEEHVWTFEESDIATLFAPHSAKFARLIPTLIVAQFGPASPGDKVGIT